MSHLDGFCSGNEFITVIKFLPQTGRNTPYLGLGEFLIVHPGANVSDFSAYGLPYKPERCFCGMRVEARNLEGREVCTLSFMGLG